MEVCSQIGWIWPGIQFLSSDKFFNLLLALWHWLDIRIFKNWCYYYVTYFRLTSLVFISSLGYWIQIMASSRRIIPSTQVRACVDSTIVFKLTVFSSVVSFLSTAFSSNWSVNFLKFYFYSQGANYTCQWSFLQICDWVIFQCLLSYICKDVIYCIIIMLLILYGMHILKDLHNRLVDVPPILWKGNGDITINSRLKSWT